MKETSVKRYDIYLYNFGENKGSIQSGLRPVLVIQDDRMNENSPTTIVAAITTAVRKRYLPAHVFLGQEYGLEQPSMVMVEQIRVVNKSDLIHYIGQISDEHTKQLISNAVKKTMGLWNYEPRDQALIRCLCPQCMEAYKHAGNYVVKRLDPFQKIKDSCEKCNKLGWDYVISKRR